MRSPLDLSLWPAIDLSGGRVVRLLRGEAGSETVYPSSPAEAARLFESEGADGIHVVDLDAAFRRGSNRPQIDSILAAVRLPVQVGGGIRTREDALSLVESGASRLVLGSLPFEDAPLFERLLLELGPRLVVALDCRGSRPAIRGWTADAGAGEAAPVAADLAARGTASLLVTDIDRDGTLSGPNLSLLASVRGVFHGEILASGGIRGEEDLPGVDRALEGGARGVILGRALHSGQVTVECLRRALGSLAREVSR